MDFEKVKNVKIVFDNTIEATQESVGLPFMYNDKPIGVISRVYDNLVECVVFDKFSKCYPEYIRKSDDLRLNGINMYLE